MTTRTFAPIFGIAFLAIGMAGFIRGLVSPQHATHPDLAVDSGYGQVLGLFPINILHNIVHLAFGIWGLVAYRSHGGARGYAKGVAIIYAVLTVMGLIPGLDTMFGLAPLFGNDVWLHALLAAVAAYFGIMHRNDRSGTADRI